MNHVAGMEITEALGDVGELVMGVSVGELIIRKTPRSTCGLMGLMSLHQDCVAVLRYILGISAAVRLGWGICGPHKHVGGHIWSPLNTCMY